MEKTGVSQEVLDVIARHGGLARTPDDALARVGYHRLYSELRGGTLLVSDAEFVRLQEKASYVLGEYHGYIFCDALDRLRRMSAGEEVVTGDEIMRIRYRAERFIEAGIPPIFEPDFYTPVLRTTVAAAGAGVATPTLRFSRFFPTTDFILQYGSGNYERRMRGAAVEHQRKGVPRSAPKNMIGPATVQEVQNFRRWAFTDGARIDPALIREVRAYVLDHFKFKSEGTRARALEHDDLVFLFLEETLGGMPHEPRIYEDWDGDTEVVRMRRWYLRFAPATRSTMIRAFLGKLPGRPVARDRAAIAWLKQIFPEEFVGVETALEVRAREEEAARRLALIQTASETQDYRLPEVLFVEEPWKSLLLPAVRVFFRAACERLGVENPEALFGNAQDIHTHINLPARLALVPEFKDMLDVVRLARAQALDDGMFTELFTGERGRMRMIALGHAKSACPTDGSAHLHAYLLERYRELCAA